MDRALERRRHRFARYADDGNVYVCSRKAASRVIALLRRCHARLRFTLIESKSAVASLFGCRSLGYVLWRASQGEVHRGAPEKTLHAFKHRVRQLTRSIEEVVEKLRSYLLGWKGYYGLAQIPRVSRRLGEWIRRRLRTLYLKHWR